MLLGAATTLLLGVLLAVVRRSFPPFLRPALGLWLRGNLLQPVGFVLYALRDQTSVLLSIVLANIVIVLAFSDYLGAIYRLLGRPEPRRMRWLVIAAVFAAVTLFTFVQDLIAMRIVVVSGALAVLSGLCAAALLSGPWAELSAAKRVTGVVFGFGVLVLGFRILHTLLYPDLVSNGLESSIGQVATFATGALLPLLASYGFLLLCTDRMRVELERSATTDHLTGLLNRRAIEAAGRRAFAAARQRGTPCAVLMLDLDHFKRINDERGHGGGDEALVQAVARLEAAVQTTHALGRFGGEEFLLLLDDHDLESACGVAERMRAALAAGSLDLAGGPWPATISVGVAALSPQDRDFDDLLRRADSALYQAKQAGRNRVARAR